MPRMVNSFLETSTELNRLESSIRRLLAQTSNIDVGLSKNYWTREQTTRIFKKIVRSVTSEPTHSKLLAHEAETDNPHEVSDATLEFSDIATGDVSTSMHGFCLPPRPSSRTGSRPRPFVLVKG